MLGINRRRILFVLLQIPLAICIYIWRVEVAQHPFLTSVAIIIYEFLVLILRNPSWTNYKFTKMREDLAEEKKRLKLVSDTGAIYQAALNSLHKGDYKSAIASLYEAIEATQQLRVKEAEIKFQSAQRLFDINNIKRSVKLLQQSLELLREAGAKEGEHVVLARLGYAHLLLGEFLVAIENLQPAMAYFQMAGNAVIEYDIADDLGSAYAGLGNFESAAEMHLHALMLSKEFGDSEANATILTHLGADHSALGQYSKAIKYIEQAYEVFKSLGAKEEVDNLERILEENRALASKEEVDPEKYLVQFSAYCPRTAQVGVHQSLYVYAHLPNVLKSIENDIKKFSDEFSGGVPSIKSAGVTSQIKTGTPITVIPECDEIEFEPPILTKKWNVNWSRFNFGFIPLDKAIGQTIIRISVQVKGLEIAHIACYLRVGDEENLRLKIESTEEKLSTHAVMIRKTAYLYRSIFVSYSRKDKQVIEIYKFAHLAIGDDVFIDMDSIRAGEAWQSALAKAIDGADIFQLFWSDNSAVSTFVEAEWRYALTHKCPENKCVGFIRPVYWQNPMPPPPEDLKHLHFKFVPLGLLASSDQPQAIEKFGT